MPPRPALRTLPHVGRSVEMTLLGDWLRDVAQRHGGMHLVAGQSGVGKTRLVKELATRAENDGWLVTIGRVYSVESGVPYAVWSDALLHLLRAFDGNTRNVLTRGGDWLGTICPAFATETRVEDPEMRDGKARLLWNASQFLARVAERHPLLLILENLHSADTASIELLHFAARQVGEARVAIIGTYNETELEQNPALREMEQSLLALGVAKLMRLDALSQPDIEQLVCQAFGVDHPAARQLARRLYSWTRGHPFFVEETLKSLVESGKLYERDGGWFGWEVEELDLPRSVRSAVSKRLDRLSAEARRVAGFAAVIGAHVSFTALRLVCDLPDGAVLAALDELSRAGVLVQTAMSAESDYEFAHPVIQDVVHESLGLARTRLMHTTVARALESAYGDEALARADVLAFHYARAEPDASQGKAARYLAAAGRDALARHADRAAANYLSAALELRSSDVDADALIDHLAQARQRLGEYDVAMALWQRARAEADAGGNPGRSARVQRRMGLACYWSGRFEEALAHFDAALSSATRAPDTEALQAQIRLNRGTCWQSFGRPQDAAADLTAALETAERLGDAALLARAHRALMFLHIFLGPPATARLHGERAIALATETGDKMVAWSAHWGLATLAGLTGDGPGVLAFIERSEQIADELQSPLLRVYTDEISIEYAFGSGNWDAGVALAERTIAMARALNQKTLLPRLLVWATHFYTARGEYERAKLYLDEAWQLGVAAGAKGRPLEVHSQVPAYMGLASYYLAVEDFTRAVEIGQQGLAIADRSGYVVWAIHRLIPVIAEAAFHKWDIALGAQLRDRMRQDCERMGHRLGLVWVTAGDGIVARMRKEYDTAARLLRQAAEELEQIPWVYDAARLRRWLADVLIRSGDEEGGLRELRRSHEVCAALGARVEMERVRRMMKVLGVRPPARESGGRRPSRLTSREMEIARLVAEHKSNKEIGVTLGISARTVTTHVANIFGKLGVSSRGELANLVRDGAA